MPWARWRGTRFSPLCLISEKMILLSMILLNRSPSVVLLIRWEFPFATRAQRNINAAQT